MLTDGELLYFTIMDYHGFYHEIHVFCFFCVFVFLYFCVFDAWDGKTNHGRDMLGRQVQTKEAGVDHEIGEETGAAENLIFHNMKNMNLEYGKT